MKPINCLFASLALCLSLCCLSTTASAQGNNQAADTGNANAATNGTNATAGQGIQTVPDTSAFDQLPRGASLGSAATTGFGPGATDAGGGATGFGGGFGGGGFGGGGLGGLFGGGFGNASQSATPLIRTRLRSAIQVDPISSQQVQINANERIVRLPRRRGLQNVQVNMIGRTAVLAGTTGSDRDRRMAELLMRLEPGVSQIQNNVVVSP